MKIAIELEESERQLILLALAHLSQERPGWICALQTLALKMDNKTDEGPEMFEGFRRTWRQK